MNLWINIVTLLDSASRSLTEGMYICKISYNSSFDPFSEDYKRRKMAQLVESRSVNMQVYADALFALRETYAST